VVLCPSTDFNDTAFVHYLSTTHDIFVRYRRTRRNTKLKKLMSQELNRSLLWNHPQVLIKF
jgi:hypothetical protein